ncbi:COMM domain-containing protein 5-like [Gigantopelta aegis]|uniref:COMM domain-containing protein 5-like n=1 Tax=Gigantopelta aegis TaxID=1735272 RepID=UPI001B88D1ED|nr:COMM domain-containing protein 5-like [Gigantopelta aegis]
MSIIQVMGSGSKASSASERMPFVGARVPLEIKAIIKPLSKLEKGTFQNLLKLIVSALEGKCVGYKQLKQLETSSQNEELLTVVYTGIYTLLKCALKQPPVSLKVEHFKEDLQDLQIPEECHADIASVVFGNRRAKIDKCVLANRPRLPSLDLLRWRVDVAISTSVLNRVLEPTVLMEMTLHNGRVFTFEVSVHKFHELRYSVAYVLKEMEELEKRSILKIQD